MSLIVIIMGTNAVGKTTLAKSLMQGDGGVHENGCLTLTNNMCFVGKYTKKYGGVDGLNRTKDLHEFCKKGLELRDVVVCEGSKLNTFGNNLLKAIFVGEKQLIIALVADLDTLKKRIKDRAGRGLSDGAVKAQKNMINALVKWNKIGVPVVLINTSAKNPEEVKDMVLLKINNYVKILQQP